MKSKGPHIISVDVFIEIPKGSRNKYEYDPAKGAIRFDRTLFSSVHYPGDYGFIENTLGKDGDPLDALVLMKEHTFPGCIVRARPVGILKMEDEKGEDDKVLCVPIGDPEWNSVRNLADIPNALRNEIENFFQTYKILEGKKVKVHGWKDRKAAVKVIRIAQEDLKNR